MLIDHVMKFTIQVEFLAATVIFNLVTSLLCLGVQHNV